MKQAIKEPELIVNDHHGIYIAQVFCQSYKPYITNMDKVGEDFDICLQGPDHPEYIEAWIDLMDNVEFTNDKGEKYTVGNLGESGDLWAIPEGYEYPDEY